MAEADQPVARSVQRACETAAGTVQSLAADVGVSYAALCSWSRGRRRPPARQLATLAEVLESRAEQLKTLAADLRDHAEAVEVRGSRARRGTGGEAEDAGLSREAPEDGVLDERMRDVPTTTAGDGFMMR